MLKQNPVFGNLTDEQLTAIATMSERDENTVIGARIGGLHGQYDTDIFEVTGVKKNDGEKSYDYAKRVLNAYKGQVQTLQADKTSLQKQLEKAGAGADEAIRTQLKDAKKQVEQLQNELVNKSNEMTAKAEEFTATIKKTHLDYAFQAATSGLKFKAGISEPIQKTLLSAAKAEIFAKGSPDLVENQDGSLAIVIRDTEGNILSNPKNNLNPYSISELLMETSIKDVLDTGKQQPGGGTGPTRGGGKSESIIDLTGVKNQIEADKAIEAHLLSMGITRDSAAFSEQSLQLRNENNVSALPIR